MNRSRARRRRRSPKARCKRSRPRSRRGLRPKLRPVLHVDGETPRGRIFYQLQASFLESVSDDQEYILQVNAEGIIVALTGKSQSSGAQSNKKGAKCNDYRLRAELLTF